MNLEGKRFKRLAQAHIVRVYHRGLNDADRRLIRDHEIRAETFAAAAKMLSPGNPLE